MFSLPVWDLLSSYDGDSQSFSFEAPIFDGFYEDIQFIDPLSFSLKIIAFDEEIHGQFSHFKTKVRYEKRTYTIHIPSFERIWKMNPTTDDPDDIRQIDTKNMTIDFKDVIREEIIMECHALGLE